MYCILYIIYKIQILAIRTVYRPLFQLLCSCPPVSILCVHIFCVKTFKNLKKPQDLGDPLTPPPWIMDNGLTTPYKKTHFLLKNVTTDMDHCRGFPAPYGLHCPIWTLMRARPPGFSTALDTTNMLCSNYRLEQVDLDAKTCFLKIAPKPTDLQMCQIKHIEANKPFY